MARFAGSRCSTCGRGWMPEAGDPVMSSAKHGTECAACWGKRTGIDCAKPAPFVARSRRQRMLPLPRCPACGYAYASSGVLNACVCPSCGTIGVPVV